MSKTYLEFAFILFGLMGACIPSEQALAIAEQKCLESHPADSVAEAKQQALQRLAIWDNYKH